MISAGTTGHPSGIGTPGYAAEWSLPRSRSRATGVRSAIVVPAACTERLQHHSSPAAYSRVEDSRIASSPTSIWHSCQLLLSLPRDFFCLHRREKAAGSRRYPLPGEPCTAPVPFQSIVPSFPQQQSIQQIKFRFRADSNKPHARDRKRQRPWGICRSGITRI